MTLTEMTLTDQLLGPVLADAARPRITDYDDVAGSRVELSGATLANWAAKTANWLRDELDVEPGDRLAVLLPPHWQTAGILLGCWWCGGVVSSVAAGAVAALCPADRLSGAGGAAEVAAVSLDPLGAGVPVLPTGVRDYAGEVRAHGDTFSPEPLAANAPATPEATVQQLVEHARGRAAELGLRCRDRLLCTTDWDGPAGAGVLLTVLAADASLVQCAGGADTRALARRAEQERVTATLGTQIPGLRALPGA